MLGNVFSDQVGIGINASDFDDVNANLSVATEGFLQSDAQLFDTGATTTNNYAGAGGVDGDIYLIGLAFDADIGDTSISKVFFDVLANTAILLQ